MASETAPRRAPLGTMAPKTPRFSRLCRQMTPKEVYVGTRCFRGGSRPSGGLSMFRLTWKFTCCSQAQQHNDQRIRSLGMKSCRRSLPGGLPSRHDTCSVRFRLISSNLVPGIPPRQQATYDVARKYRDWVTLIVAVKTLDMSLFDVADDDGTIPKGLGEVEQLTHLSFRGCRRTGERTTSVAPHMKVPVAC